MLDFLIYSLYNIKLFFPNFKEINSLIGLFIFVLTSINLGFFFSKNKELISINFFAGYGIIYIFSLFLYVFLSFKVITAYLIILLISFLIYLINFKKFNEYLLFHFKNIKKNYIYFILLLPLILLLFNSKGYGWDVYSHWLPLANALQSSSEFMLRGHATNYPFANSIVLVFSSILNNEITENISALFSIIQLIFVLEISFNVLKKQKILLNQNLIKLLLILLIFYNPIHMNKFVYSSYTDFDFSIASLFFLFAIYYLYQNPVDKKNYLLLILIGSLLIGIKNTGLVFLIFILLSFSILIFFENYKNFFKKYFIPLFIISIFIFFVWMIWQYLLIKSSMTEKFIVYEYIRMDLLRPFFKSVIFQIGERKLFYFFSFLIIFLRFFKLKNIIQNEEIIFFIKIYSLLFIFWFLFLIITYIFHFNSNILSNGTSFWRYNFHTSVILLIIFISLFFQLSNSFFKILNNKKIISVIGIFIIIIPVLFLNKLRRDLSPDHFNVIKYKSFQNKVNRALIISRDSSYNAVRLNYYLNNDYRKSIVDYKEINTIKKNYNPEIYSKNRYYDLVIILDQENILNFKEYVFIK